MAQTNKISSIIAVVAAFAVLLILCGFAQAAEQVTPDKQLLAKYHSIRPKLEKSHFGIPLDVTSHEESSSLQVVVYGIFHYPFEVVGSAVGKPDNWCKITPLHLNIKSCVSSKLDGEPLLKLYSGRKTYQLPEDAYQLDFRFRILTEQPDYLKILIHADKGPFFTKNHRITLEAVPVENGATFVRFSYAYNFGTIARLAIQSYFSAMGGDKVGFSLITTDPDEKPQYVRGVRGAVERNAVRYYLALQAYLDSLKLPVSQQFEYRISRWFNLTAKFPRQLYEMEKGEYMASKRREHANQLALDQEGR